MTPSRKRSIARLTQQPATSPQDKIHKPWVYWAINLVVPILLGLLILGIAHRIVKAGDYQSTSRLSKSVPYSGGLSNPCAFYSSQNPSFSPLHHDSTGLIAVIEKFPQGRNNHLDEIWKTFEDMSINARTLKVRTAEWKDTPSGTSGLSESLVYSSSIRTAAYGIKQLKLTHRSFINTVVGDVNRLKRRIRRKMDDYSDDSYIAADHWESWPLRIFGDSPLARVKRDYREFAAEKLAQVHELALQSREVLIVLNSTQTDLHHLRRVFQEKWERWARNCTQATNYYFKNTVAVNKKETHCNLYELDRCREILQQDLDPIFESTAKYVQKSLEFYQDLECRYQNIIDGPRHKTYLEKMKFEDNRWYRKSLTGIMIEISAASTMFHRSGLPSAGGKGDR